VPRRYLGSALAVRSLAGFGAGAIPPAGFGVALDFGGRSECPAAAAWGAACRTLIVNDWPESFGIFLKVFRNIR
jgi:hypothetical protein